MSHLYIPNPRYVCIPCDQHHRVIVIQSLEVGLYKYTWDGLEVNTIESIHPDVTNSKQFVKTKKNVYHPSGKDGVVLKTVPREYRSIDGYDWFTMY